MEEKKYGMTWLKIYTGLFILRVVSMTISVVTLLTAFIRTSGNDLALAILFLLVIEYIFEIITLIHFLKKTEFGYTINMVYIFLSTFISAFNVFFQKVAEQGFDAIEFSGVLFACVILLLVWSLPNYIYFKHRKFLFTGSLKEKTDHNIPLMDSAQNAITTSNDVVTAIKKEPDISPKSKVETSYVSNGVIKQNNTSEKTEIPSKQLKQLKVLRDEGILTEEEFKEKKRQILNI